MISQNVQTAFNQLGDTSRTLELRHAAAKWKHRVAEFLPANAELVAVS